MSLPGSPQAGAADLPADKPALRLHYRRLRRQALVAAAPALRIVATAALPDLLAAGQRLGLYWPVGSEPDLDPLASGGLAEQLGPQRLALPAVLPPAPGESLGRLVYLPWAPGEPLRPDACGIPSPLPPPSSSLEGPGQGPLPASRSVDATSGTDPSSLALPEALPPAALGLLLVPALALDARGIRLGSGGGWYDRLRADPAWGAIPALAVLPSACRCQRLPADPWDVPFSGWLDEHGIGWCAPLRSSGA